MIYSAEFTAGTSFPSDGRRRSERHTRHFVRKTRRRSATVQDPEPPITGQRDVEIVTDQYLEDHAPSPAACPRRKLGMAGGSQRRYRPPLRPPGSRRRGGHPHPFGAECHSSTGTSANVLRGHASVTVVDLHGSRGRFTAPAFRRLESSGRSPPPASAARAPRQRKTAEKRAWPTPPAAAPSRQQDVATLRRSPRFRRLPWRTMKSLISSHSLSFRRPLAIYRFHASSSA